MEFPSHRISSKFGIRTEYEYSVASNLIRILNGMKTWRHPVPMGTSLSWSRQHCGHAHQRHQSFCLLSDVTMKMTSSNFSHILCTYVTCSNEMSRMSANLISRKHRINTQRWISTILTFCHQSILWYLFCQLAMLISRLYYYIVHFIAFLDTLRNISRMNFVKQNR